MTGEATGGAHLGELRKVANIFKCVLCITHVLGIIYLLSHLNFLLSLEGRYYFSLSQMKKLMLSELLFWFGFFVLFCFSIFIKV